MQVVEPEKTNTKVPIKDVAPRKLVRCDGNYYVTTVNSLRESAWQKSGVYAVAVGSCGSWLTEPQTMVEVVKAKIVIGE